MGKRIYVALVHYPVTDKNGATIASAVTNLDLHDIARACRTYGAGRYYVVTPLDDQAELVDRILDHWVTGAGKAYNPERRRALELVRVARNFVEVVDDIAAAEGVRPVTVATTARKGRGTLSYRRLKAILEDSAPVLLVFGTAWGLEEAFMAQLDFRLDALTGQSDYNHLSVRCAAAIILDRLVGREERPELTDEPG